MGQFPIFTTSGSNDDDCGDYTIEANGTCLSDTSEVAPTGGRRRSVCERLEIAGQFYSAAYEDSGYVGISLNGIFWLQKYRS
jgi:hypothetical protein